ncbi:MAG TPA: GntR family transcriptional regulator [Bauldia sp.]|nr:GntR family transcriptional regulator [Bauldia sp.]
MDVTVPLGDIPLDRARRAAPQVYEWLRDRIISLDYAPGTTLSRVDLVRRFGLSQTPIRDALMRLSGEGLVDIFPQSTTQVARIDLRQATQTHFLRRSLEIEIVRQLALAPDKPFVPRLNAIVAEQRAQYAAADLVTFEANDKAFHRVLYESANVPDLWTLIRDRSGHIDRLRRLDLPSPGKIEQILASHSGIVEAIASSDPAAAQSRLREHLSGTLSHIDDIRAAHPSYVRE